MFLQLEVYGMDTKKQARSWTTEELARYGKATAAGYLPGMQEDESPSRDEWTTQRHLQAAKMRSQVFVPGF
jgi:hypothetical protein